MDRRVPRVQGGARVGRVYLLQGACLGQAGQVSQGHPARDTQSRQRHPTRDTRARRLAVPRTRRLAVPRDRRLAVPRAVPYLSCAAPRAVPPRAVPHLELSRT